MKVFRGANGEARFFRIDDHMNRFRSSCGRLVFPDFDPAQMKTLIEELVRTDLRFLSSNVGECLYVRPTAISMYDTLGVKRAENVKLFAIMSPVKKYFEGKIHLAICDTYDRGNHLSSNYFKLGANYAPTVAISEEYQKKGYSQVLWLNNDKILESGATNIFFIIKTNEQGTRSLSPGQDVYTVQTPPNDGAILPGLTRDSILALLPSRHPHLRIDVSDMTLDRFERLNESGQMVGAFATGTASVVGKVHSILKGDKTYHYDYSQMSIVEDIKKMITEIQHGHVRHPFSTVLE